MFTSVADLTASAAQSGYSFAEFILRDEAVQDNVSPENVRSQMEQALDVMIETSRSYEADDRSGSGLSGGQAGCYRKAASDGSLFGGEYWNAVTVEALKTAESNACMKRIVAAPTAGSCGVLPAVLLPLLNSGEITRDQAVDALFVAGAFGEVIASRATVAGASGGCQAEIGSASSMAAAALVSLKDGTPQMCAHAAAMALTNLLGLVCDPIAGLVEIPCVKRNVTGAVNAVSCANMALAGLTSRIPCDEVIDAMGEVGTAIISDLRETGVGGLAGTPTGRRIADEILHTK